VVAPKADLKIYLSADPSARAERRALEAGGDVEQTQADLVRRDTIDSSRATAPLVVPKGAIHVDSTFDSLEEVIARIVGMAGDVARSTTHG
jgi:cytidylate kinase